MGLINVIRAELFKASCKRRVYVFACIAWILPSVILLGIAYTLYKQINIDDGGMTLGFVKLLAAPITITRVNLVLLVGFASFLTIIVALSSTLFIGEERNYNMWKTVLVAEPSRFIVLLGKIIAAMLLLFFLFIGCLLSGVVFGFIGSLLLPTEFDGNWLSVMKLYALQWSFTLSMLLFGFLMVFWIRNNALSFASIILLPVTIEGLYTIYTLIKSLGPVNNRFTAFLEVIQLRSVLENLPKYFLTSNFTAPSREVINTLEGFPELEDIFSVFGNTPFANMFSIDLTRSAIVMGVYIAIFGFLLFWSFKRRDVS